VAGSHITLGASMITLVEPHAEGLLEYNRWYEQDHALAAVTTAPGCFAHRRFVATRDLKALRYPADSTIAQPVTNGSFIALYWVEEGRFDECFGFSFAVTPGLAADGRMNPDRDHVSTGPYLALGSSLRDVMAGAAGPMIPELALDHPYPGLVVLWVRPAEGTTVADLAAWCRAELDPATLGDGSPVGQVVDFVQTDYPGGIPALTGKVDELVRCYFVDVDPRECWDDRFADLGDRVAAGGLGRVELAAPFIPTVPGTTRYLDELW
jgi:hypothetical protein